MRKMLDDPIADLDRRLQPDRLIPILQPVQQLAEDAREIPAIDLVDDQHERLVRPFRRPLAHLQKDPGLTPIRELPALTRHRPNPGHEILIPIRLVELHDLHPVALRVVQPHPRQIPRKQPRHIRLPHPRRPLEDDLLLGSEEGFDFRQSLRIGNEELRSSKAARTLICPVISGKLLSLKLAMVVFAELE